MSIFHRVGVPVQNILLVWLTPGDLKNHGYALIPSNVLPLMDWDAIDGRILNQDPLTILHSDQIKWLYEALGLEPATGRHAGAFASQINRPLVSIPDRIVKFGWAT